MPRLPAQGAFRAGQLGGAHFGGGAAFGHALLQSFIEPFEVGLGPGAFRHFVLQGAVGPRQFQRPLLDPRLQPFVRPAQGLLDPLAFRHLGHENGGDGENHEPHGGGPQQFPGAVHRFGHQILRHVPSRRRGQGDDQSGGAPGEPGDKTDRDQIESQKHDRAGDVIHRPGVHHHNQPHDEESRA